MQYSVVTVDHCCSTEMGNHDHHNHNSTDIASGIVAVNTSYCNIKCAVVPSKVTCVLPRRSVSNTFYVSSLSNGYVPARSGNGAIHYTTN